MKRDCRFFSSEYEGGGDFSYKCYRPVEPLGEPKELDCEGCDMYRMSYDSLDMLEAGARTAGRLRLMKTDFSIVRLYDDRKTECMAPICALFEYNCQSCPVSDACLETNEVAPLLGAVEREIAKAKNWIGG